MARLSDILKECSLFDECSVKIEEKVGEEILGKIGRKKTVYRMTFGGEFEAEHFEEHLKRILKERMEGAGEAVVGTHKNEKEMYVFIEYNKKEITGKITIRAYNTPRD